MIEQISGLPPGALGFRATGQVTARDYERVLVPDVEAAFALNRKLRLLYHVREKKSRSSPLPQRSSLFPSPSRRPFMPLRLPCR
jgi:hypothetical protein